MADSPDWGVPPNDLTIPPFAGPGEARIVIGPDIPPLLANYISGLGYTIIGAFLSYDQFGDYYWQAAVTNGLGQIVNAVGFYNAGLGTFALLYTNAQFPGPPITTYTSYQSYVDGVSFDTGATVTFTAGAYVGWADASTLHMTTPLAETTYTPAFTATTVNPTIGTTGNVQTGRYVTDPWTKMVDCQIRIQFGTVGPAAGTGTYIIDLPTPLDLLSSITPATSGRSDFIGSGSIIDNSGAVRRAVFCLAHTASGGSGGVGQIEMIDTAATSGFVGAASPWAWAASDSIALTLRYRSA